MTVRSKWMWGAVLALLLMLLFGRWIAVSTADRLWAHSLAIAEPLNQIARVRRLLLTGAFLTACIWCIGQLYFVYRAIGSVNVPRRMGNIEILEAVPRRYLAVTVVVIGLALAALMSYDAGNWWYARMLSSATAFAGPTDPLLGRELSYYVFQLPWRRTLHGFVTLLSVGMLIVITFLYAAVGALRWINRRLYVNGLARIHLATLGVAVGLALFWGYRLELPEYVSGVHNVPFDSVMIEVRMPVARLLSALALVVTAASGLWIWVPRVALVAVPWTVLGLVSVIGHYAVPAFAGTVRPFDDLRVPLLSQAQREYGELAFDLVEIDSLSVLPSDPDPGRLREYASEFVTAPVWDRFAVNALINRGSEAPTYSRYSRVQLGVREVGVVPRPYFVTASQVDLAAARRAEPDITWENVHMGPLSRSRGVVTFAASGATPIPRPDTDSQHRERDITVGKIETHDVDVLFGPETTEFALIARSDGAPVVGVPVDGLFHRFVFAWALQSPQLLTAVVPTNSSLLWHRSVAERLGRAVPFAVFEEPFAILDGDALLWIANGYVSGESFPFAPGASWRGQRIRHLHAGFVGVVDATSGATSVYLAPDPDPLSQVWTTLLPGLVEPADRMPPIVRKHLRYPTELLHVQAQLYREREFRIAAVGERPPLLGRVGGDEASDAFWWFGSTLQDREPRLRLRWVYEQGEPPMLSGFAEGAVVHGERRLYVWKHGQPLRIPGPSQLAARFQRARSTENAVPGVIKTLPTPHGVLFTQSSYVTGADGGDTPELVDVVVGWGSVVERGPDLNLALQRVAQSVRPAGAGAAEWAAARRWFEQLDRARRTGDWVTFGRAYQELQRLLRVGADTAR